MESFEEQFVHEFYMGKNNKGEYIDDRTRMASFCYEAGQQSKQAEVDELREMVRRLVDNTIVAVDDALENQANDLLGGNTDES